MKLKPSLLLNSLLCIRPLTFTIEAFCLVATIKYVAYMTPSIATMAPTLTSLPGVHNKLCY